MTLLKHFRHLELPQLINAGILHEKAALYSTLKGKPNAATAQQSFIILWLKLP
jgi:hypothetical protein